MDARQLPYTDQNNDSYEERIAVCSVNTLVLCPICFGLSIPSLLYGCENFKNFIGSVRGSHCEERSGTITIITLRASKMSDQEGVRTSDRTN